MARAKNAPETSSDGKEAAPRDIYLAACERVAEAFAGEGFSFAKTGPRMTRTQAGWKQEVSFQSSHHNVPGERIALWVHANLKSAALKKWRKLHKSPFGADDMMGGGQIGNLRSPTGWIDWDLADARGRDKVIASVVKEIRALALPFFAKFQDLPRLRDELGKNHVPGLDIHAAVELLLWHFDAAAAARYVEGWLERRTDLVPLVQAELLRMKKAGLPKFPRQSYAITVAVAIKFYELPVKGLG
jgi:hypothetical protein